MTLHLSPAQFRRLCLARGLAFDLKLREILGAREYRQMREWMDRGAVVRFAERQA